MTIQIATKLAIAKRTHDDAHKVECHAKSLERVDHPHARSQYARAEQGYKEARRLRCEALVELVTLLETRGEVVVLRHVMYEIAKAAQAVRVVVECWDDTRWTLRGRGKTVNVELDEQRATMTLERKKALDVAFTPEEVEAVVESTPEPVRIDDVDEVAEAIDRAHKVRALRSWHGLVNAVVDADQAADFRVVTRAMLGVESFSELHGHELGAEAARLRAMHPGQRRKYILRATGYLTFDEVAA